MIIANCHEKTDFLSSYTCLKSVSNISFSSYWYDIWLSLITFRWNSFQHAFTTTGIWSVIFRKKTHRKRHILKLFFIEMPVSLKVFVPEKRDCTFWKWQNLSFKLLCWHVEMIFIQMIIRDNKKKIVQRVTFTLSLISLKVS